MMKSRLSGVVCVYALTFLPFTVHAVTISGHGTWETTLQGRDLDGNASTFEAYYDSSLDITWLADANAASTTLMNWSDANAWASALDVNGIRGWRLPTTTPLDGSTFNMALSTDGSTDRGTAATTTDGTDGGWRDGSGIPASEMGHMYYVTLGNLGHCDATLPFCTTQTGWGLDNTGPFSNLVSGRYWSKSELNDSNALRFSFYDGIQDARAKYSIERAWAVRTGDVGATIVPIPAAIWLFGSGLLGLIGTARAKRCH